MTPKLRKILMSVCFPPEIAAPILKASGIFGSFCSKNPHAHKIPPFRGILGFFRTRGGESANFIFMGVGIFPQKQNKKKQPSLPDFGVCMGGSGFAAKAPKQSERAIAKERTIAKERKRSHK